MSEIVEFVEEVAGVYIRSYLVPKAFVLLPQHVHTYDHATLVCSGSVRLWVNGERKEDYKAGHAIEVKAGQKHHFQTLEPNTRLACLHHSAQALSLKVA